MDNQTVVKFITEAADKRHDHARKCKKPLDECIVCEGNIRWFAELPPMVLAQVLQEAQA